MREIFVRNAVNFCKKKCEMRRKFFYRIHPGNDWYELSVSSTPKQLDPISLVQKYGRSRVLIRDFISKT